MTEPNDDVIRAMAEAAGGRARMWELSREVAARPTEDFVQRLREGDVEALIRESAAWLGEESPFHELLGALRAYQARAARYTLDADFEELATEWERLRLGGDVPRVCAQAARQAESEARAWAAGAHEEAKALRAKQFQDMERWLEALAKWCQRADAQTRVLVTRVLVRIVAAHVTVEGGRDLLGALERTGRTATFRF